MILANSCGFVAPAIMDTGRADIFFKNFDKSLVDSYMQYWESIRPQNLADIFRRYLFSFMSVHTTWQGNVRGYNSIKEFDSWIDDKESLRDKLRTSGVGLHNNRTEYIWDFKDKFWKNPKDFFFTSKKGHVKKRDSMVQKIKGLSQAKISFSLEQIHPNECRVFCGDTHMLELYGMKTLKYNSGEGLRLYKAMERHWSVNCGKIKVPCYIARCIYWDGIQGKENSKYWAHVFED